METPQRTALRKCRVRLVNDLQIDEMFDAIETHEIFTPIMLEYIKAKESRPEKVRVFLDYLQRRGPDSFEKFLQVLRESGHNFIVSYILQEYNEQIGQGVPKLNPENRNGLPPTVPRPPNIYHTQETQTSHSVELGQESMSCQDEQVQGSSIHTQESIPSQETQVSSQEAQVSSQETQGTSQEMQGPSQETQGLDGDVEMGEGEMEHESSVLDLSRNIQESGEHQLSEPRPSSAPGTSSNAALNSSVSVNVGYTGNLNEEYRMESDPRGLLLIINNCNFHGDLGDRIGTNVDGDNLRNEFLHLGFGVDVRNDLTALEILANLKILSQHEQLEQVDCLTVAILTHGSEDILYGVDGNHISVKDALEPFTAEECPALHHKPKFFIINACRGDSEDKGSLVRDPSNVNSFVKYDAETAAQSPTSRIPNRKDFLIAYSTIPGYVSWRHENDGSWFIQELVKVFRTFADKKDVLSMLVKVNDYVAKNINHSAGLQIPAPVVMLTKTWHLNPIQQPTQSIN